MKTKQIIRRHWKSLVALPVLCCCLLVTPVSAQPVPFTVTFLPESSPTYPAGTQFRGDISTSDDPLDWINGTGTVHFRGTNQGGNTIDTLGGTIFLIYRACIVFDEPVILTEITIGGVGLHRTGSVLLQHTAT